MRHQLGRIPCDPQAASGRPLPLLRGRSDGLLPGLHLPVCRYQVRSVLCDQRSQTAPHVRFFDGVYNTLVFAILGIIIPRIANSYNDVGGYASLEFFDTL